MCFDATTPETETEETTMVLLLLGEGMLIKGTGARHEIEIVEVEVDEGDITPEIDVITPVIEEEGKEGTTIHPDIESRNLFFLNYINITT